MKSDKIIKFPITHQKRIYNNRGKGHVPCIVTDRWLRIGETYEPNRGYVSVDVMTDNVDGVSKKLTSLIIRLEDLQNVLNSLTPNKD